MSVHFKIRFLSHEGMHRAREEFEVVLLRHKHSTKQRGLTCGKAAEVLTDEVPAGPRLDL